MEGFYVSGQLPSGSAVESERLRGREPFEQQWKHTRRDQPSIAGWHSAQGIEQPVLKLSGFARQSEAHDSHALGCPDQSIVSLTA